MILLLLLLVDPSDLTDMVVKIGVRRKRMTALSSRCLHGIIHLKQKKKLFVKKKNILHEPRKKKEKQDEQGKLNAINWEI